MWNYNHLRKHTSTKNKKNLFEFFKILTKIQIGTSSLHQNCINVLIVGYQGPKSNHISNTTTNEYKSNKYIQTYYTTNTTQHQTTPTSINKIKRTPNKHT